MTGTIINIATVLIGGSLGLLIGVRLPDRLRQTVVAGLGLFTAAIGLKMTFDTQNAIIVLVSLLIGGVLGEWWRIEDALRRFGAYLESRFIPGAGQAHSPAGTQQVTPTTPGNTLPDGLPAAGTSHPDHTNLFVKGFLTASLVFCVGPMTILGSIQDGLSGDYSLLAIKSVLDGFASLAFASSLGVGVLFSTLVILFYQGGLSLLAAQAQAVISAEMMAEMTAVGGVLLIGIAFSSLLEIKPIRVGNFLPALLIAPLLVVFLRATGISY